MRVICPYTVIAPETRAALDASGYPWEARDVSGSESAYWELLAELWGAGEAFALVEHDVIPSAEVLASLGACQADWCAAPFPYVNGLIAGLGCTRFRPGIITRNPDLLNVVALMSDEKHPPRHWCRLDAWTDLVLSRRGERRCRDHPQAGHLGRSPSHGCAGGPP
jgi:hypothetical protein